MGDSTRNTYLSSGLISLYDQCLEFSNMMDSKIKAMKNKTAKSDYLKLLRNILLAYIRFGQSMILLINKGDVYSSLIILRTIFELHVLHLYIRADKHRRSKDYYEFVDLDDIRQLESYRALNLDYRISDIKQALELKIERLGLSHNQYRNKYGKVRTKWSRKSSIKEWCEEVDRIFPGENYRLGNLYKTLYDYLSGHAHSGPSALLGGKFNRNSPKVTFDAKIVVNKYCSFSYDLLRIINEEFNLNFGNELTEFRKVLLNSGAREYV